MNCLISAYYKIQADTDKYFCQNVLKDDYDGFITVYPPIKNKNNLMFNYELTVCSKITFNNTCSPITYRYGSHAEFLCNCDNSYYNLNCALGKLVTKNNKNQQNQQKRRLF